MNVKSFVKSLSIQGKKRHLNLISPGRETFRPYVKAFDNISKRSVTECGERLCGPSRSFLAAKQHRYEFQKHCIITTGIISPETWLANLQRYSAWSVPLGQSGNDNRSKYPLRTSTNATTIIPRLLQCLLPTRNLLIKHWYNVSIHLVKMMSEQNWRNKNVKTQLQCQAQKTLQKWDGIQEWPQEHMMN